MAQSASAGHRAYPGERLLRNTVLIGVLSSLLVLVFIPIVVAIRGSFYTWNPLNDTFDFIGTENYRRLVGDKVVRTATRNTLVFCAVATLFRVVIGLALANALYSKMVKSKLFFRAVYYMPSITPLVAVAYVWKLMFNPKIGFLNSMLGTDINWLNDSAWAVPSILLLTVWKDFGYSVLLFLAGIYSIPDDVMEAAQIDGATAWQRFMKVTLPMLKPMMIFVVITSLIGYMQSFVQVLVLTEGGPGNASTMIPYLIYEQAFDKYNFGYASAIAVLLLIVTGFLTAITFVLQTEKKIMAPWHWRRARKAATS